MVGQILGPEVGRTDNQYSIPKALIHEEAFSDVSLEAKMLYGLIMERMGMYRKNKWQDEQGRVYAGTTMSNYYRAEVNHDMPQFAG